MGASVIPDAGGAGCYRTETIETILKSLLLVRRDEHVARAPDGLDDPRVRRVLLELAPQPVMRMSIERSNGSHSRLRVMVRSWSRESTWFGCWTSARRSSNSIAVIGISCPLASLRVRDFMSRKQRPTLIFAAAADFLSGFAARRAARSSGGRAARAGRGLRDVVVRADFQPGDPVHHVARAGHHDDADVVALAQVARRDRPSSPGSPMSSSTTAGVARSSSASPRRSPRAPRSRARRGTR